MSSVIYRFLRITAMLLIYALLSLSAFNFLSLAQEPSAFEIRVVSQAEYAVAGQPFTYTIVITNVSQMPVKDVIVFMETPPGTTFASASQNSNWFVSELGSGETGKVGWATSEPIGSGTVLTFELRVNVLPEMAKQQLINSEYAIVPMGGGDIIASGPPIKIQVLATAPTATPVPSPTSTATDTPMPTATPSATLTPHPTSTVVNVATPVPITPPQADTTAEATPSSSTTILAVIGLLLLLIIVIAGLIWFSRRR